MIPLTRFRWTRRRRFFLAAACSLAGLAARASTADAPAEKVAGQRQRLAAQFDRGDRWAVVVGVNRFDDKALSTLRFCVADAKLVTDVLVERCMYPKDNVILLADGEAPSRLPTRENVLRELTTVLKRLKAGDTVLVYVACHGGPIRGQSQLCPRDFDSKDPGLTGIRVDVLRDMLHDSRATQKLLVIDACHSGGVKSGAGVDVPLTGDDLEGDKSVGGLITFAAARKSQTSLENGAKRHGIFTYSLARGLGGEADTDRDGIVDSDELYRFLHDEVEVLAREMGQAQTPVRILGQDVTGVFAMARVAGEAYLVPQMKAGQTMSNSIGMEFALLMPASFTMGSPIDESGRDDDESAGVVRIARPFFVGRHEVTQAQYRTVRGKNPSWFQKDGGGADAVSDRATSRWPVEQVTWDDAIEFCRLLGNLPDEKKAGRAYRLPTEAEWEFACRAGTTTVFHAGDRISALDANVDGEKPYLDSAAAPGLGGPTKVGSYPPNAWGLHDMHGNVWEWCSDWYATRTPASASWFGNDLGGPPSGDRRVVRGGAYSGEVALCRSASRRDRDPTFAHRSTGFRVVCVAADLQDR